MECKKKKKNLWKIIIKVIVTVATTVAGALGISRAYKVK